MPTLERLRRVTQEHDHGCAIASIATVAGVSYADVARRHFGRRWSSIEHPGMYTSGMMKVLRSFDMKVRFSRGFDFKSKKRAILFLDNSVLFEVPPRTSWHCLVWDPSFGGYFIDPAFERSEGRNYYLEQWKRGGRQTLIVSP